MNAPTAFIGVAIAGVVLGLTSKRMMDQWDGAARQSCPNYPNEDYLFLGKAEGEGGRCGYLANGTAPRCRNTAVHLPLRSEDDKIDQGDLACFRHICTTVLGNGEDCSVEGEDGVRVGMPSACASGVCWNNTAENRWECAAEHHVSEGEHCVEPTDCSEAHTCTNRTCVLRTQPNGWCTHLDNLQTTLPGATGSRECTADHYCTQYHDGKRCVALTFGEVGTPCWWDKANGHTRPACLRGKAYCDHTGTCKELRKPGEACLYDTAGSVAENGQPWQVAHSEEFCKWGLFIDPAAHICTDAKKVGQTCNATAQCTTSTLDAGRATCQCTKSNELGGPGVCKKVPLAHPLVEDIRFPEECRNEFRDLTIYLEQFYKRVTMDEAGRNDYDTHLSHLRTRGYCCLRKTVRVESHMYYLSGLFALDLVAVEVRCNTDLMWLWVVVGVLGVSIVVGICVVLSSWLDSLVPGAGNNSDAGSADERSLFDDARTTGRPFDDARTTGRPFDGILSAATAPPASEL